VLRAALDALAVRLDGRRAAANTISRKRAVFHNALGYAVETRLLDANPADHVSWRRGLKHRPEHAVRAVPIPPVLVTLLRRHHDRYGTADDGRLFPGSRGGLLSESTYGRTWQQARTRTLSPATAAAGLAMRPYDLRHAALSLWLSAGAPPAQIAARAGHSVAVLLSTYAHCIDGQDEITNRQIEHALSTHNQPPDPAASVATHRQSRPDPVRHTSASGSNHAPRPAHRPRARREPRAAHVRQHESFRRSVINYRSAGSEKIWPTQSPQ
jgi:hypothetical protein